MKLRCLIRVTRDYQVSECELEKEYTENSDPMEVFAGMQEMLTVSAKNGLNAITHVKPVPTQQQVDNEPPPGFTARTATPPSVQPQQPQRQATNVNKSVF